MTALTRPTLRHFPMPSAPQFRTTGSSFADWMRWCFDAVAWLLWRRRESCDGVDVSKYRGIVDWPAVKASEAVRFAYAEASHGADPDGQYDANCSGCAAAQIPFGAFHFLLFTEDVGAQARTFMNQTSLQE